MLTEIDIEQRLAVVNGYVEIPDGPPFMKTKLTTADVLSLIPGARVERIGRGPSRIVDQEWVVLPAYERSSSPQPPLDYYAILRAAAS